MAENVVQAARDDRDLRTGGCEKRRRRRIRATVVADFEDVGSKALADDVELPLIRRTTVELGRVAQGFDLLAREDDRQPPAWSHCVSSAHTDKRRRHHLTASRDVMARATIEPSYDLAFRVMAA